MSILAWALLCQLVVFVLGFIVLWGILNNMLADMAVRYIELWRTNEEDEEPPVRLIHVISHRPLKPAYHERIRKALRKNFPSDLKIDFTQDAKILGGVVIRMDEKVMDCSLRDRIQRAFGSSG